MAKRITIICFLLLGLGWIGCDYGVSEQGLMETEEARCVAVDEAWSELEGALFGNGEDVDWLEISKVGILAKVPPFFVAAPPEFVLAKYKDDTPNSVCQCVEVCNLCADAYICGHEAMVAQACQECAKCQQECNKSTTGE